MVFQYVTHRNTPRKIDRNGNLPAKYNKFLQYFYSTRELGIEQSLLRNEFNYSTKLHKASMTYWKYMELLETEEGIANVTAAMEQFIRDYDADVPFDGHLELQVPRRFGLLVELLQHHDMMLLDVESGIPEQFQNKIVPRLLVSGTVHNHNNNHTLQIPTEKARHRGSDTNPVHQQLSNETKQKVCQLTAIDYCCLNYKLPEVCEGVVSCRWRTLDKGMENGRLSSSALPPDDGLYIEAISPYPPWKRKPKAVNPLTTWLFGIDSSIS